MEIYPGNVMLDEESDCFWPITDTDKTIIEVIF